MKGPGPCRSDGGDDGEERLLLLLLLFLVLFQYLLTCLIDFEWQNLALVDPERFLPDRLPFFCNIKFPKK